MVRLEFKLQEKVTFRQVLQSFRWLIGVVLPQDIRIKWRPRLGKRLDSRKNIALKGRKTSRENNGGRREDDGGGGFGGELGIDDDDARKY
uniref:Uncharacterized protein n=1 Tax=Oryza barthii TaxID=65489 RepID=A0A0D3H6E5_9ORYZ